MMERKGSLVLAGILSGVAMAVGMGSLFHARRFRNPARFRFHPRYREDVTLRDGTRVRLRLIRPEDKRLLAEGMRRLSAESRYHRVHVPKSALSEQELRYLTEVDGINHFAMGAVNRRYPREGLAVARFVRIPDEPQVAEAAIAVLDRLQHLGLGRLLFQRLIEAARERGFERLRCEVLALNTPAIRLLTGLAPRTTVRRDGICVQIEIPVQLPEEAFAA
jgi:GNAT superfamily N-acetyltransferase